MDEPVKIMIVDDEPLSLSVTAALLEDQGYEVVQRDTALGTMLAVRREKPQVVLLDVQMPGLNGDALTKLILDAKSEYQPIVILHSTTAPSELERIATSCNATGFIEKTSDHRSFLQSFERIVSRALGDRARQGRASLPRSK